jgi:uncharacterized protein
VVPDDLRRYIVYRCIVGSRAYGLERESSDTDVRGLYLPPARLHWSLDGVPEQLEDEPAQECFWELGKFLKLALRCNPNVLECLHTPLVEHVDPIAEELLGLRSAFLSVEAHKRYRSYAADQMRRLGNKQAASSEVNWRHAMHMIRLLICGTHLLRTGEVKVVVREHRDELLAVRDGKVPWPDVEAWAARLGSEMDEALLESPLPKAPDRPAVEAFLIRARRSVVER